MGVAIVEEAKKTSATGHDFTACQFQGGCGSMLEGLPAARVSPGRVPSGSALAGVGTTPKTQNKSNTQFRNSTRPD